MQKISTKLQATGREEEKSNGGIIEFEMQECACVTNASLNPSKSPEFEGKRSQGYYFQTMEKKKLPSSSYAITTLENSYLR